MGTRAVRLTALLALASAAAVAGAGCNAIVGVDFGAQHGEGEGGAGGAGGSGDDASDGSVVPGPDGGTCAPKTCAAQGFKCGTQSDGCENAIDCGTCTAGQACTAGQCACVPRTCPELAVTCGTADDGCGHALDCGACAGANEACTSGKCACAPKSCSAQGATCGTVSDGCGGTYDCGICDDAGATPYCSAGSCGASPCTAKTCGTGDCGELSDGCGGTLTCPGCTAPQTCGGGGTANQCGCTPLTCAGLGTNCGSVADGCGGTLDCGTCTAPQSCDGAGTANVCGCTPTTCGTKNCGAVADGCGGNLSCGTCVSPKTCGGTGVANVCGCTPIPCTELCCGGSNGCGGTCGVLPCCGGGGGGCFVAGTPIAMADGTTRPIEDVRTGDMISAYDVARDAFVPAPVLETLSHGPESSADGIVIVNGTLRVTTNHPIWVDGQRVRADHLDVGSSLTLLTPGLRAFEPHRDAVRSLELVAGSVPTFNLRVGGPGTYVAGGIVVFLKD